MRSNTKDGGGKGWLAANVNGCSRDKEAFGLRVVRVDLVDFGWFGWLPVAQQASERKAKVGCGFLLLEREREQTTTTRKKTVWSALLFFFFCLVPFSSPYFVCQ